MASREKRVSVRFAAAGGDAVKAEMRDIGNAGNTAMDRIAASAAPAEAGLENVSSAALKARQMLEQIATKAAASAQAMRATAQATTAMQDQINRATGVMSPTGMSAAEMLQQGQALDNLRAKFNPIFGVVRQYRNEVSEMRAAHLAGAISADELAAAISRSRQAALGSIAAYKNQSAAIAQMSRASRGATLRMQQMFFQVNDIGVSLAGGMNPFIVMAQQGTQIAQIYGFGNGGVGAAFRDIGGLIGGLVTKFWPVLVAVGAVTAAIGGMTSAINETSAVTVTMGDTALAVWQVISEGIWDWIKPAVDMIAPWFQAAWDLVVAGVTRVGNWIIKGFQLAVAGIDVAISTVPAIFETGFFAAKSIALSAMSDIVLGVHNMLDSVAQGFNSVFGTNLSGPSGLAKLGADLLKSSNDALVSADAASANANFGQQFGARASEIIAGDPMGDFFAAVSARAQQNARNRLDAENDGKGGRGGAGKAAKEQKDAVADLVKSLTQELAVLRETDPVKKKMLEYSEQLKDATAAEREQVLGLVTTLDEAKNGWEAIKRSLAEYVEESKRIGDDIGSALVGAFEAGSDAVANFVKTGKLSFTDMVTSMIVDMARLGAQKYIMGPLANLLTGFMDPLAGALGKIGLPAIPSLDGGGHTGFGARAGGLDGKGGFLAMMHPQERVYDEYRGRRGGGDPSPTVIHFNGVRDAASFRQSRTQIAADLSRAVSMGRRNM